MSDSRPKYCMDISTTAAIILHVLKAVEGGGGSLYVDSGKSEIFCY
jgi:hypothetical protein